MPCSVCKSQDHYPINCPDLPVSCGGCNKESTQKEARLFLPGGWRAPKKGSRFICPDCAKKEEEE